MEARNVTLRLNSDLEKFLRENSNRKGIGNGIQNICENYATIVKLADSEIMHTFTEAEMLFFYDSFNGAMVEDWMKFRKDLLIVHNSDAELYDKTATKHGIDLRALNEKCSMLSACHVFVLFRRIEKFWNRKNTQKPIEP